ncbi:cytochrome C biogenesis protein, partial [Desulfobacteraceae bacterium SEEP-SAG9]
MKLGYQNVHRDPLGYPPWKEKGLPVETSSAGLSGMRPQPEAQGVLYGWA